MTGAVSGDLPLSTAQSTPLSLSSISAAVEGSGAAPVLHNYPAADVVSANLLVEGLRLSAGKGIVERCEQLWFSDLGSGITPSAATAAAKEPSSSSSSSSRSMGSADISLKGSEVGEGPGKIYPNDYTFELMSKIWVENGCKDIASRSQNLFDRWFVALVEEF
jgi:hypothetical protein